MLISLCTKVVKKLCSVEQKPLEKLETVTGFNHVVMNKCGFLVRL
jgi:hypothetical protein